MNRNMSDDANDAMWQAMETNDPADWDNAITLAQEADRQDPIPGAHD